MKKIFTLMAAFLCMAGAAAQSFTVTYQGKTIQDGERINAQATIYEEDYGFGPQKSVKYDAGHDLKISGDGSTVTINAKLDKTQGTFAHAQVCIYPKCQQLTKASPQIAPIDYQTKSKAVDLSYETIFTESGVPNEDASADVTIRVTSGSQQMTFYIHSYFDHLHPTGIHNTEIEKAMSYADGVLRYNFTDAQTRVLTLSALDGKTVSATTLLQNGTFQLPNYLVSGVYVLSLRQNGVNVWSQKVIQ